MEVLYPGIFILVFAEMHLQMKDILFQFLEHLWKNILGIDSCERMVVQDQAPELQDEKTAFLRLRPRDDFPLY